ncbi:MAG: FAD-dependent oxidoreductase [Nakamurella sp.]
MTVLNAIDRLTGRVTMYRLVLLSLSLLVVLAFGLSLAGSLPYSPLDLGLSLAVLLLVTYLSNRLYAGLFGVRPHSESGVITALLLFFLLWPSSAPIELLALGLAAAFASASKYLIAYRGRHIVNPAAAGVVFVTLLHLTGGVWWVATAPMLPVVAVLALLVAYRTRRLPMVGLFIAVGGLLVIAFRVGSGDGVSAAVEYAFVSTPLVFFAGFMLTEPLTLPPLFRQQLAIAAGVAVLFALPNAVSLQVGDLIALSPELALVIGNIVSFVLGQRRGIELTLKEKRNLGPTTAEFVFESDDAVKFRPGQYMELTVPHSRADSRGIRRVFSISSADSRTHTISFGIKIPADGGSSFKRTFADLAPGSRIQATTVGGDFVLPEDPKEPLLLIAGGIGITPFISHLAECSDPAAPRDVVLVYAVADPEEIPYLDVLAAARIPVVLIAPRSPRNLPQRWESVTGRLTGEVLNDRVPDIADRHAYVSGPPALVSDLAAVLRGLKAKKIKTDAFIGY